MPPTSVRRRSARCAPARSPGCRRRRSIRSLLPNIAALAVSEISALTTTRIGSLTTSQVAKLTPSQIGAMSMTQLAGLSTISSYSVVLGVLEDEALGGMNPTKLAALKQFDSAVHSGAIEASQYVSQMLDNVVKGNSANKQWNGGLNTATSLGNLSASSTQQQVDELIGKWFLGTDLPSTNVSVHDVGAPAASSYQSVSNLPLFGSGGPQYTDVNQGYDGEGRGYDGDSDFMSALAETAKNDPSLIQNMIQSNGNGTYSVLFHVNGQDDYVTVNSQLAVMSSGQQANGSKLEFANGSTLWAPLIEKAYAELMEQTVVTPGVVNQHGDSYADIAGGDGMTGGDGNEITAITGQSTTSTTDTGNSSISSLASQLSAAMSASQDVLMYAPTASDNLVAQQTYEVIGFDASTNTVTLQNPWNTAYSGSQQMQFKMTLQQLTGDSTQFIFATGKAASA